MRKEILNICLVVILFFVSINLVNSKPLDCEIQEEYTLTDNVSAYSINTNVILTNNLAYPIPLYEIGLNSSEYNFFFTFIDNNTLNFTKNLKMSQKYMLEPNNSIKMTIISLKPKVTSKDFGDYYGIPLNPTSSYLDSLNWICGRVDKITQKVILEKNKNIFKRLDVWEVPLYADEINDRENFVEYTWIKEGDVMEPTIVFYRYINNKFLIRSSFFWGFMGALVGALIGFFLDRYFKDKPSKSTKDTKSKGYKKIPTPQKP